MGTKHQGFAGAPRGGPLLIAGFLLVALVWPLALARFIWLPDGWKVLAICLALLTGTGMFFFTVSGRAERTWRRSVQLSVLSACAVIVLVLSHVGLVGVYAQELDTMAPAVGAVNAGEAAPPVDPSFPSNKVLRVATTSPTILDRIAAEQKYGSPRYNLTELIKSDPSFYWDTVREEDGGGVLKLTLAFLAAFLGSSLSAAAFVGCLAGLVTGGLKEYEDKRIPLPEPGAAIDVFISYSHSDRPVVLELALRLKGAGLVVWFDCWDAKAGSSWPDRIHTAMETARAAIICRGATDVGYWQGKEISGFLSRTNQGLTLIPVILPGCAGPQSLTGLLASFGAVDLREGLDGPGVQQLLDALSGSAAAPAGGPAVGPGQS